MTNNPQQPQGLRNKPKGPFGIMTISSFWCIESACMLPATVSHRSPLLPLPLHLWPRPRAPSGGQMSKLSRAWSADSWRGRGGGCCTPWPYMDHMCANISFCEIAKNTLLCVKQSALHNLVFFSVSPWRRKNTEEKAKVVAAVWGL